MALVTFPFKFGRLFLVEVQDALVHTTEWPKLHNTKNSIIHRCLDGGQLLKKLCSMFLLEMMIKRKGWSLQHFLLPLTQVDTVEWKTIWNWDGLVYKKEGQGSGLEESHIVLCNVMFFQTKYCWSGAFKAWW